jgi:acetylornithine deacetylase/succinyl-diaminopimelate desuccinylase-like protein
MKLVWILLTGACAAWAQPSAQSSVDWNTQKSEILTHYRDLIRIDTRAGNETKAVEYIRKVLEGEGIPTKTLALDPARANLVARLNGNGSKRPILILAHTDVVGVQPEKWPVDPFSATIKDGLCGDADRWTISRCWLRILW